MGCRCRHSNTIVLRLAGIQEEEVEQKASDVNMHCVKSFIVHLGIVNSACVWGGDKESTPHVPLHAPLTYPSQMLYWYMYSVYMCVQPVELAMLCSIIVGDGNCNSAFVYRLFTGSLRELSHHFTEMPLVEVEEVAKKGKGGGGREWWRREEEEEEEEERGCWLWWR